MQWFDSAHHISTKSKSKESRTAGRRHKLKKLAFLWLPVICWMGLIFYLSSRPGLRLAEGVWDFWTRKPLHVGEYAILFLLFVKALKGSSSWEKREVYIGAGVLTFLFAVTDELHQFFVPLREGKLVDLVFDLLGIGVGVFLLRLKRRKKQ